MTEQRMRDVSQRNPAEPRPASDDVFGRMFQRGPSVAADGGEHGTTAERDAENGEGAADADETPPVAEQRMKDVDQTPPDEDASANRVWERGGEPTPDEDDVDDVGSDE
jgi:hypothetical protein